MRTLREGFGVERFQFHGFCFCFVNKMFSNLSDFTFFAKLPSYEELHPPMRPLLDAGLCIESSRGSSRRAAAAISRAFCWGGSATRISSRWLRLPAGLFCLAKMVKFVVLVVEIFLLCCDDMGFGFGFDSVLPRGWSLST